MSVNYSLVWTPPVSGSYATSFSADESELSEGGLWIGGLSTGLDWTAIVTSGGIARGSQTGGSPSTAGYNDSVAHLQGFPANHRSTITVHRSGSIDSTTREVECLGRFKITPHNARGYEFLYSFDGSYSQIVRWNGPLGDSSNSNNGFTVIGTGTPNGALADGDMLKLEAVGTTLTGYRSTDSGAHWSQIGTCTDSTFSDGDPGFGLWKDGGTDGDANLGVSHFSADSL